MKENVDIFAKYKNSSVMDERENLFLQIFHAWTAKVTHTLSVNEHVSLGMTFYFDEQLEFAEGKQEE